MSPDLDKILPPAETPHMVSITEGAIVASSHVEEPIRARVAWTAVPRC